MMGSSNYHHNSFRASCPTFAEQPKCKSPQGILSLKVKDSTSHSQIIARTVLLLCETYHISEGQHYLPSTYGIIKPINIIPSSDFCWAGLAGHKAGLVGPKGKGEDLLGLSNVLYTAQMEITPTRSYWRTCGLSIVKGVMAKREINHELTYCL